MYAALLLALSLPAHATGAAPVADAGLGVLAYVGDTVVLNGTASTDAEGDALTYTWTQLDGAPVALDGYDTAEPAFVVDAPGPYRFQLVVNDGALDSAPDEVALYVPDREATPSGKPSGCSTAPAAVGWLGVAVGLVIVGRRRG